MDCFKGKYLLFLFLLPLSFVCSGQVISEIPHKYELGFSYLQGFAMKHDKYMGHLSKGITHGGEFSFIRKSDGRTAWQRLTNFPDVGLSITYFDYPSPVLGKSLGINGFSDYYLFRSKRFSAATRIGIGLGFHTKPYDKETNNKNVAYGSPVTFSLQSKLILKFQVAERWLINGSAGISHYSLADIKRPNKGVNILAAYIGINHLIGERTPFVLAEETNPEYSRRLRYSVNLNGAPVTYKMTDPKTYPAISFSAHVQKPVSPLFDLQLGIDLFNNAAMAEVIKDDWELDVVKLPDHKKAGISGGFEYKMNKISIQFNLGYYVYAPYKGPFGNLYQRYGLKFYTTNKIFIYTGFKSHRADAENAEFGLGYRF